MSIASEHLLEIREMVKDHLAKHEENELTPAQQDYAASDVLYLHQLREALDAMLAREGRTDLARAAFDFLPTRARLDLGGWPDTDIFSH